MTGAQVFTVTDNVWCVRRPSYLTCSYLVRTPRGIVLVDAGMDSTGRDVMRGVAAMKADASSVRSVLLTHWHNDHAAGTRAIQDATNVTAYCHADDSPQLKRETARMGLRGTISELIPEWGLFVLFKGLLGEATPRAVLNPRLVSDGEVLDEFFEVVATPGHTPGHVSYYYKPARILFAGDALAVVNDNIRFMARAVTPDVETARNSMRKCLTLDIDVLCPGHRTPLKSDVRQKCDRMLDHIDKGGRWPILG